jgi:hypothetical protein
MARSAPIQCRGGTLGIMLNLLLALAVGLALTGRPPQAAADIAGTWNISLQGHQIALVLDQHETAVSGTLMMMNVDVPVTGTFTGRALAVSGTAEGNGHLGGKV